MLEFEVSSGTFNDPQSEKSHLRLEIYNPLSGEVFEAKFPKGRVEVDNDGSLAYFSTNTERINMSLFLGYNLQITFHKDGRFSIRSPSKIKSVRKEKIGARKKKASGKEEVISDTRSFKLE